MPPRIPETNPARPSLPGIPEEKPSLPSIPQKEVQEIPVQNVPEQPEAPASSQAPADISPLPDLETDSSSPAGEQPEPDLSDTETSVAEESGSQQDDASADRLFEETSNFSSSEGENLMTDSFQENETAVEPIPASGAASSSKRSAARKVGFVLLCLAAAVAVFFGVRYFYSPSTTRIEAVSIGEDISSPDADITLSSVSFDSMGEETDLTCILTAGIIDPDFETDEFFIQTMDGEIIEPFSISTEEENIFTMEITLQFSVPAQGDLYLVWGEQSFFHNDITGAWLIVH